jgi:spermidine synthase
VDDGHRGQTGIGRDGEIAPPIQGGRLFRPAAATAQPETCASRCGAQPGETGQLPYRVTAAVIRGIHEFTFTLSQIQFTSVDVGSQPVRAVLILIGFTAVIAQIELMRELIVVFYGNEITLGLTLCTWLLWTAIGSSALGRLGRRMTPRTLVAGLEVLIAAAFPVSIVAVRASRTILGSLPGEILGPAPMFLTSFLALGFFCAVSGWLFAAGSRLYSEERVCSFAEATSSAYLLEAVGSCAGGLVAGLILIRYLGAFDIAAILALLNLLAAAMLTRRLRLWTALIALVVSAALRPLDDWSRSVLWRGFQVVAARNSVYGNLVVAKTEGSSTLYENGLVLFDAPNPAAAEEAVHFALLEHPEPRSVLLVGGGGNGSLAQALQHPSVARLDYVELDPMIPQMDAAYFPHEWAPARTDPRVHVHSIDGRLFLKNTAARFDVIIINLPDPDTAQLNRFYTLEFFREARRGLAPGGILSLHVTASENYISPAAAEFLRCIHKTLRAAFPETIAIPGDTVHFCATTRPGILTADPAVLLERLRSRHVHTDYVSEFYLPFRLAPDRVAQLKRDIRPQPDTPVNGDFAPIAYYFDVTLWSTRFHYTLKRVPFSAVAGGTVLLLLAAAAFVRRRPARIAGFSVATMGFTLIGMEILLLLAFQAMHGYVYQQLALIIAGFMAGLACGAWRARESDLHVPLAALQAMATLLPLGVYACLDSVLIPWLAVMCGMLGGFQFPVASRIFFNGRARGSMGALYGLDLAGSCVGAIVFSVYLIPVYGFFKTSLLLALVNLAPALLAALSAWV